MKIQLALDDITLEDAIKLCNEVKDSIGIIEVGTPMIIEYGLHAIREIRRNFPNFIITADPKIIDAGYYEANQCFKAGANIVTVLGVSHKETFEGALKAAKENDGKIMVDMICVDDIETKTKELIELGVDYIAIHNGVDVQDSQSFYEPLEEISKHAPSDKIVVAGGVNIDNIGDIAKYEPSIVIAGGSITKSGNPEEYSKKLLEGYKS